MQPPLRRTLVRHQHYSPRPSWRTSVASVAISRNEGLCIVRLPRRQAAHTGYALPHRNDGMSAPPLASLRGGNDEATSRNEWALLWSM